MDLLLKEQPVQSSQCPSDGADFAKVWIDAKSPEVSVGTDPLLGASEHSSTHGSVQGFPSSGQASSPPAHTFRPYVAGKIPTLAYALGSWALW